MNALRPEATLDPDRYLSEALNLGQRRKSRESFWRWIEAISIAEPRIDPVLVRPLIDNLVWLAALPDARAKTLERVLVSSAPYLLNSEDSPSGHERLTLLLDAICRLYLAPIAVAVDHPELTASYRPGQTIGQSVALIEACHQAIPDSIVNCLEGRYQGGYIPGMFQTFSYSGWTELVTTGLPALDPRGETIDPEIITETSSRLVQIEHRQFWLDDELAPLSILFDQLLAGFSETLLALSRPEPARRDGAAVSGS